MMLPGSRTASVVLIVLSVSTCTTESVMEPEGFGDDPLTPLSAVRTAVTAQPFWLRGPECCFDGWAAFYFYVDPTLVPTDFNVLDFFDFRAASVTDLTVEGFSIFHDPSDFAPRNHHLRGKGAVPFWFVRSEDLKDAAGDGVLTLPELRSLDPLTGTATFLVEELHPTESVGTQLLLKTTARGTLDVGGGFRFLLVLHVNEETGRAEKTVRGVLEMW